MTAFEINVFLLSLWSSWRFCTASFNPLQTQVLGKLGIMGKRKKNSPSLWHDELAVCRGNRCYTKLAFFSVLWTVWRNKMGWKKSCVTKLKCGEWILFVGLILFLCCQAGESHGPKSFAPLGFLCLRLVFHRLSTSEMLKCFIFVNVSVN